ncbi:siroheme synthase CysG [Kangiella koreensis]|uniref:Siroheme synthase n=1 Tax=Kangiella koreensis (strain DSM 16069 / JCM 12317 / KCTC 12182 / SW-125) TaxID=523791 RepID=C7RA30_KANKD|nr:siroheme synthase CysG [Kangiella koreensis]ACV26149.1 uroporphyrin-III C-methyltransferase [Kangiella koreensis DSM 16069]
MEYFPITVRLQDQQCIIVGGGEIAHRKLKSLLKAKAKVSLIAFDFSSDVRALAEQYQLPLYQQSFDEQLSERLLDEAYLIVAATDNRELNEQVSFAARKRRIWVNVVDDLELSTFIMPAIIDRSPLLVAVSTGGVSPVLARKIREKIEWLLPTNLGGLLSKLKAYRPRIKKKFPDLKSKRDFSEWYIEQAIADPAAIESDFNVNLENYQALNAGKQKGKVYLVGAGPGDAELLTIKALKVLQTADVVLHDALVSEQILEQVRRDATLVHVGKRAHNHSVTQDETNRLLVQYAQQGLSVVRLKGGDPFIFGRGGEELEVLVSAGINYEVVPGITAASGCASYAGIPLTHRDYAQTVMFITAHCANSIDKLNWQSLAREKQTVAIYMGLLRNETLVSNLIEHGRDGATPIAIIENGTLPEQRVVIGTLRQLSELVEQHQVVSPALILIGEVTGLAEKLDWFQHSTLLRGNSEVSQNDEDLVLRKVS